MANQENRDMFQLFKGDCLELMQQIPEGSIDMVLCDPPYGMIGCKWDSILPFDQLWKNYFRVCKKNAAMVIFGAQPFSSLLVTSNIKMYKHEWIWKKNAGSNFAFVKYQPMKEHEEILVFCEGKLLYNPIMQERAESGWKRQKAPITFNVCTTDNNMYSGIKNGVVTKKIGPMRYPSSVQNFKRERGLHPTQKPVALLEYLIKTYTNEGMTVLDNCMGSGSTGIACLNTNRKFIGIEKDEKYFEIAKKRIENHKPQLELSLEHT